MLYALDPLRAWLMSRVNLSDRGGALVEYALLGALIAVVAIVALVFLGGATSDSLNNSAHRIGG